MGKNAKKTVKRRTVRRTGLPKSATGGFCPWSKSCFTCPKEDCVSDGSYYYNELELSGTYSQVVGW